MRIKHFLTFTTLTILLLACNKPAGELTGTGASGSFREQNPYGMTFIRRGTFMMGANSQSAISTVNDNLISVTVDAFWMDDTEITNAEYRQFVNWVRDSIAYRSLIDGGRTEFAIVPRNETDMDYYPINWKKTIPWNSKDSEIQDLLSILKDVEGNYNPNILHYQYEYLNYDQAALPQNRFDVKRGAYPANATARVDSSWVDEYNVIQDTTITRPLRSRRDLISKRIVAAYPDTMVWVRNFQYAYNEPLTRMYFSHPGYTYYPVVGVTWEQAQAFCNWRTMYFNSNNSVKGQDYRLPTESEWEYAARGGKKMSLYPWGGNYVRDAEGCFLANFKPYRGSYTDDDGSIPMRVGSFKPNDFGLYDMAGNVAEWTSSAYSASSNTWISDMNPNFQYAAKTSDPDILKRKVIKGGSWKDIAYYLQCGTRTYEYQYESKSYIGFRCVRSYMGQ